MVGGGSAGTSAAVAAARAGAEVTLVERYGSLGGLATGGLIALLLTLDDGQGRAVIGGLCQEFVERMTAAGGAFSPPASDWGAEDPALVRKYAGWGLVWGGSAAQRRVRYAVAYDPEVMRQILNEVVLEAGVDLLFHMWGADAIVEDDRIRGVVFQSKAGRQAILADVVIDASGDGDLLVSAGCETEQVTVHPWLWFRIGGVRDVDAALDAGAGYFRTPNPGVVLLPWGSAARIDRQIDPTDPRDLTYAEVECRRMVMEEYRRLRASDPELANAHLCNIATQIGITESRRLVGRFVLSRDRDERELRRRDLHHGALDQVRRGLCDPLALPADPGDRESPGGRPHHLGRSPRAPRHQGDPGLHGRGPGRRHRRGAGPRARRRRHRRGRRDAAPPARRSRCAPRLLRRGLLNGDVVECSRPVRWMNVHNVPDLR